MLTNFFTPILLFLIVPFSAYAVTLSDCYQKYGNQKTIKLMPPGYRGNDLTLKFDFSKMPRTLTWNKSSTSIFVDKSESEIIDFSALAGGTGDDKKCNPSSVSLFSERSRSVCSDYYCQILEKLGKYEGDAALKDRPLINCVSLLISQMQMSAYEKAIEQSVTPRSVPSVRPSRAVK